MTIQLIVIMCVAVMSVLAFAEDIEIQIKGRDDGKRTTQKRDYAEALMNAKLQAVERAGVEITSITKVENFRLKSDMVESKAKAVLLPGFQVVDIGYQTDGTYLVILIGKIRGQLPIGGQSQEFDAALMALKRIESLTERHTYYQPAAESRVSYEEYSSALTNMNLYIKLYKESANSHLEAGVLMESAGEHYRFAKSIWKDLDKEQYFKGYDCKAKPKSPYHDPEDVAREPRERYEIEQCQKIIKVYPDLPLRDAHLLDKDTALTHIWTLASGDIKKLKALQK